MTSLRRPRVDLLSEADAERIVEDACRVLEEIGALVEHEEGAALLQDAGAVRRGDRLLIPGRLVRESVARAPSEVRLCDREGTPALTLAQDQVHFDPGSAAIHILDAESGARREANTQDVIDLVRLVDGLPNYAAQSTALLPADIPKEIGDRYRLFLALRHGIKPVVTGTFVMDGFAPMREMLAVFRNDETDLRERPLAVFDCCPSPPLRWSDLTCGCLIDCARAGIPAELVSMPLAGATAPVTLREAVVQHCAENLSGLVIHQLARPASPILYGGAPSAFDMRFGSTPMGAVETMMIHLAYSQVGKHLNLPTHGYLGLSDAKVPDYQAGLESGVGAVLAALAGINLVSGPGILDYILTQSLEKLLLDHEACGMALRLVRGIASRKEDLVSLFRELVSTGEFLSHRHTRRHWREELTVASSLIDRDSYGDWVAKGSLSARERAREEAKRRLATAESRLPSERQDAELVAIMQAEARRCGLTVLPGFSG
jgi:trimethylamine--corrinoid protein Co-methyltransferase